MQLLKDRIIKDGQVLSDTIIKVDSFLNHQIDPSLMFAVGQEFAGRFADTPKKITKILTIEASGIAAALTTGYVLEVPVVYAKKKKPSTIKEDTYAVTVHSFTRDEDVNVVVQSKYLTTDDHILIIDDFLATGEAIRGMVDLVKQAGASLAGVGIVIEKQFQHGGDKLRAAGVRIESLAQIEGTFNGKITIA